MRKFMAGATRTRLSVASSSVEARSSARPLASLARRPAVAGATTTRSASRDNSMCPMAASSVSENRSSCTRSPDRLATDNGVMKCRAGGGHHSPHIGAAFAQTPDQVERLVGRDAAADEEQDPPAGEDRRLCRHVVPPLPEPLGAGSTIFPAVYEPSTGRRSGQHAPAAQGVNICRALPSPERIVLSNALGRDLF